MKTKVKPLNMDIFKKSNDELQEYLKFKRHHGEVPPKKGKGSFKRNKMVKEEE